MESQKTDQEQFDEAVDRKGKLILEVLAGVGILAALLMSMVALVQSGDHHDATAMMGQRAVAQASSGSAVASSPAPPAAISVKIVGAVKMGPDHKKHDIFTKTNYAVKVGQPVRITIDNTDDAPHSITSPAAGVNIIAQPGLHTYKMLVATAGKFQWYCMLPCDGDANGWAMQHPGYMSGYITAT
jgi:heme/copper-type cytochrome/quinol oxidase subunit 2